MAGTLADIVGQATQRGIHVRFADPISNADFDGKGICGNPEPIHGIVDDKAPGRIRQP
jgi:hypothetical protein